jgi:hypothetical protein
VQQGAGAVDVASAEPCSHLGVQQTCIHRGGKWRACGSGGHHQFQGLHDRARGEVAAGELAGRQRLDHPLRRRDGQGVRLLGQRQRFRQATALTVHRRHEQSRR